MAGFGGGGQWQVARPLDGPLVALFEQDRADQSGNGGLVGEDPDDAGAALDLAVEALERVGGRDPGAMLGGERHVGEDVGLDGVHAPGDVGEAIAELIGDVAPLAAGRGRVVLGEGGVQEGAEDPAVLAPAAGEQGAGGMDAAVLPAGAEDAVGGGLEALVIIRDHQLDAGEAALAERAEEVEPEGLGLGDADLHAEHLAVAVGVGGHRDDHRDRGRSGRRRGP